MPAIRCIIAETQRQIDDACRIRFEVFGRELGYLDAASHRVPREIDPFDTLPTTLHLVAYAGERAIGAMRILLPNPEVAAKNHTAFGLSLEGQFDLRPLAEADLRLAETTRLCVVEASRGSRAMAELHAAAVQLSRVLGIEHWIGAANTETDVLERARRIHQVAAHRGFVHEVIRIEARGSRAPTCAAPPSGSAPHRLPRPLELFARRMHARFIGPPVHDPRFRMCSLPFLAPVAEQRITRRASLHVPKDAGTVAA